MKKRNTLKKTVGLALAATFALGATSCTLFATDSQKDVAQTIASVDITKDKDFKTGGDYASYASVVGKANGTILKRDLIAYFLNVGSSYVESYGYKETFTQLLDSLVTRKIIVQYAMTYYLKEADYYYSVEGHDAFVAEQTAAMTNETEKQLVLSHPQILTMRYFLTEKEDSSEGYIEDNYHKAVYTLKKAVNDTLDSTEKGYIDETKDEDDTTFGDTRTTPTGVGTEKDDYFDEDYDIYTGHNTIDSCGDSYDALDGSTQLTRRKAYNDFLANLSINNLIEEDVQTSEFTKVDYYYEELSSQLEQSLINKFADDLNEASENDLTETYVTGKYNELFDAQKHSYDASPSSFVTAIQSVSDNAFVVYAPNSGSSADTPATFGFVYNILIPFSATDEQSLDVAGRDDFDSLSVEEQKTYYKKRSEILSGVQAKDKRAAWFSNNEDSNYAYNAATGSYYTSAYNAGTDGWLFFEDNFTNNERYEELKQYLGKYPYNGTVLKDSEGKKITSIRPNAISIDSFISEMEGYIDYSLGVSGKATGSPYSGYETNGNYTITDGKFDYSQFIYYTGKVDLTDASLDNYFYKESDGYKAVSAVNELMFAYSTDTGCFNTYFGYEVSSITDKYVAEFAYASQYAVNNGAGSYVVCATEYGWHIMYVSVKYDVGSAYKNGFVWSEREKEGTFSNLWFEAVKESTADTRMEDVQKEILGLYKNDTSVKKYQSRYQDLLDM